MSTFRLPDLGERLHEAEIIAWHVSAGDHVVSGQPLVSVETDKAVVDVPSPQSGCIAQLHGEAGAVVETGAPLVEFAEGAPADSGTVVGDIGGGAQAAPPPPAGGHVRATPAVRALARRLGVAIATVTATGAQGQVIADDVERAAGAEGTPTGEKLTGPRRAMARNMARAHAEVVPATVTAEADVDHLAADTDVTVTLVKAIAAAAAAEPALNAWYDGGAMRRTLHDRVDVGIAMDTDDGLFVPVLRNAPGRSAADLRSDLGSLKQAVATRRVAPEALRGATITLSNFGSLGGRHAALVVVSPQVAILGAGRIEPRVVARDGAPVIRRILPLSLTFDHRVVTGGEAARFLGAVIAALESRRTSEGSP